MMERAPSRVVRQGDEVVLAAGPADDPAVFERVGGDRAEQRRRHGRVDEARMRALPALQGRRRRRRVLVKEIAVMADLGQFLGGIELSSR